MNCDQEKHKSTFLATEASSSLGIVHLASIDVDQFGISPCNEDNATQIYTNTELIYAIVISMGKYIIRKREL